MPTIATDRHARSLRIAPLAIALAIAAIGAAPLSPASAQCPGCDEYTLDIPAPGGNKPANPTEGSSGGSGGEEPAVPAPAAPAPAPVAPTAPVAPATGETTVEATPGAAASGRPGIRERRGPRLPVTMRSIEPRDPVSDRAQRPLTLAAAEAPDQASILPLVGVMAAIAIVGAALGFRSRRTRAVPPPGQLAAR